MISAYNEAARIKTCLASLARQQTEFLFEVLVVDNASKDSTAQCVRSFANEDDRFHLISEKKPGSPAARNTGAKQAKGKILVFTDADCSFAPNWLAEITAPLLHDARLPIGAACGFTKTDFGKNPTAIEKFADRLFADWEAEGRSANPAFLPWAPTCNLAVKKEIFQALGGFECAWEKAGYDVDFCWRMQLAGFALAKAPLAIVYHRRRADLKALWKQLENYGFYNSQLLARYEKFLSGSGWRRVRKKIIFLQNRWRGRLLQAQKFWQERSQYSSMDFGLFLFSQAALYYGKSAAKNKQRLQKPARFNPEQIAKLATALPAPYRQLQLHGWCYWPDQDELILFHPEAQENLVLNPTAWTIWEAKAMGADNEMLLGLLGVNRNKRQTLKEVDEFALHLRNAGVPL